MVNPVIGPVVTGAGPFNHLGEPWKKSLPRLRGLCVWAAVIIGKLSGCSSCVMDGLMKRLRWPSVLGLPRHSKQMASWHRSQSFCCSPTQTRGDRFEMPCYRGQMVFVIRMLVNTSCVIRWWLIATSMERHRNGCFLYYHCLPWQKMGLVLRYPQLSLVTVYPMNISEYFYLESMLSFDLLLKVLKEVKWYYQWEV